MGSNRFLRVEPEEGRIALNLQNAEGRKVVSRKICTTGNEE